jgi:hypothetical protein
MCNKFARSNTAWSYLLRDIHPTRDNIYIYIYIYMYVTIEMMLHKNYDCKDFVAEKKSKNTLVMSLKMLGAKMN